MLGSHCVPGGARDHGVGFTESRPYFFDTAASGRSGPARRYDRQGCHWRRRSLGHCWATDGPSPYPSLCDWYQSTVVSDFCTSFGCRRHLLTLAPTHAWCFLSHSHYSWSAPELHRPYAILSVSNILPESSMIIWDAGQKRADEWATRSAGPDRVRAFNPRGNPGPTA